MVGSNLRVSITVTVVAYFVPHWLYRFRIHLIIPLHDIFYFANKKIHLFLSHSQRNIYRIAGEVIEYKLTQYNTAFMIKNK